MRTMTRYALYYTPAAQTLFWQLGCAWLGRDPTGAAPPPSPSVPGISPPMMTALTASARRYGFHATLKAPFRLAPGFGESDLLAMAQAFASAQPPVALPGLEVSRLNDFLALCPAQPTPQLDALAMRVVAYFDPLRAAPTADELARRRKARLSPRQDALLQRWGYPYMEEEFRFHMTLTDSLITVDAEVAEALKDAAITHFKAVAPTWTGTDTVDVDGLGIFKESGPGAPFELLERIPFSGAGPAGNGAAARAG